MWDARVIRVTLIISVVGNRDQRHVIGGIDHTPLRESRVLSQWRRANVKHNFVAILDGVDDQRTNAFGRVEGMGDTVCYNGVRAKGKIGSKGVAVEEAGILYDRSNGGCCIVC